MFVHPSSFVRLICGQPAIRGRPLGFRTVEEDRFGDKENIRAN